MMRRWLLVPMLVALSSCASSDESPSNDGALPGTPAGGRGPVGEGPAAGFANGGGAGRPPEREAERRYLAPVATDKYLWTANPLSGRVAIIDSTTLAVTLETAGNAPRQVVGLPAVNGRVGALVLNERSDDATLFRIDAEGRPVKYGPFRTHGDANSWAVSASGLWAVAWTDAGLREAPDPLETFQDVTVFSLSPDEETVTPLTIGARPSSFAFSADERYAYAVTDEGISVIALDGPAAVTALVPLSEDPLEDPGSRDVSFAPDGSYALVRGEGKSEIRLVELPEGALTSVTLPSVVTDVDLAPDGRSAFAVLGLTAQVVEVPLERAADDPASFPVLHVGPTRAIGSIALNSDASALVLYSTVVDATRLSVVPSATFADPSGVTHHELIAPVTAVFAAPDPRFAVAFQGPAAGSVKAGGFSLLSLATRRSPRIVATDASPVQIAFAPGSPAALVTVRSDTQRSFGAYLVDLPSQQVDRIDLASPPEAAGVVAASGRAYVAQSHPEGRITFISMTDRTVQTLTGFELAARIRSD